MRRDMVRDQDFVRRHEASKLRDEHAALLRAVDRSQAVMDRLKTLIERGRKEYGPLLDLRVANQRALVNRLHAIQSILVKKFPDQPQLKAVIG